MMYPQRGRAAGGGAALSPPLGQVSTPDDPAFVWPTVGSQRLTAKVQLTSPQDGVAMVMVMQRNAGASNIAFDFYSQADGTVRFRQSSSGTALEQATSVLPAGTIVDHAVSYVGVRFENTGVSSITAGLQSFDNGATWTEVTNTPRATAFVPFDSTASLVIGGVVSGGAQRWLGVIYWLQLEQLDGAGNPTGVIWRFDAADAPLSSPPAASYVDPRGRSWALAGGSASVLR